MADKRQRLTSSAVDLSHRIGLSNASIATIAEHAEVPVGNVYYYFKTKDDIAGAVIEALRDDYEQLRSGWDETLDDPNERLIAFVDHTRTTADDLTRHGCPIGGLCQDLAQTNRTLGSSAGAIFADTIHWATDQFRAGGHPDPEGEARQLVALLQGATVLAHATDDADLLLAECDRIEQRLRAPTI